MPATKIPPSAKTSVHPGKTGVDLLHNPSLNKGTAFTNEERKKLGLLGLLPPRVSTMDQQVLRLINNIRRQTSDLQKYVEMIALLDRNETLFYRAVQDYIDELMPIIYTPTVGAACQMYAHIFRRSRGIFITKYEKGAVKQVLKNWPHQDVRVIVVTDGERILGLGDLGCNGMGIPVGKLSLYTACAGIHPEQTLPVMLDVGTNNEKFLNDPLYLGMPEKRIAGKEYDDLIHEFVQAVQEVFPKALIQFEDFANHNAFRLLEKYRDEICTFNDDIQGTASVTLAGLFSTTRLTGMALKDMKILFHGAGEAAIGIADLIVGAMVAEGLTKEEAKKRCWFVDSKALVESSRSDLQDHKKPYAHKHPPVGNLAAAVKVLKPTALIGVSGMAKQFTKEIVEEMSRINQRPVIFALSNPTSQAECSAEEAYVWSDGRALFASGSPFAPVEHQGRTYVSGQGNNAYIFPGVGLGVVACAAKRVTDEMFYEAAKTLARLVTQGDLDTGCLFPPLTKIREVSAHIAAAVMSVAYRRGLATEPKPRDMLAFAKSRQYEPVYKKYA
ncbi:MAG TPA: NAD-dependent malic enzyme [Elusimicrobia bacterium]|nr:MAG: NAD-dependent malic enzyme [Elusimicrobia bacterium GWA2_66_18]HAZ09151.1 NAD-dependent malic enzyme [Elusimicrobiota bacterium]